MLNKPTVIIFADTERALTATAVKEQISEALPQAVVIVIDDLDLHADAVRDFIENVFKLKVNLDKNRALRLERKLSQKIDETPQSSNLFKNRLSYKNMENIFNRYTPDLVVTLGYGAFLEAVAVRDKLGSATKVVSLIDDYALNRQLINTYVDEYIVENMAVKTTLVNNYVKEAKVVLADTPVAKAFTEAPNQKEALRELRLNVNLPTVLAVAAGKEDNSVTYEQLASFKDKFNVIIYNGCNREAHNAASAKGLSAYNEGTPLATLYAAADIVLTPPETAYVAAARRMGKLVGLLPARTAVEQRNAEYLKSLTVSADIPAKLRVLLSEYPADEYENIRITAASFRGVSVGVELVKLLGNR